MRWVIEDGETRWPQARRSRRPVDHSTRVRRPPARCSDRPSPASSFSGQTRRRISERNEGARGGIQHPRFFTASPSVLACASKRMRGSCIAMTSAVPSVAPTSMTTQVRRSGRARCRWPLTVGCVVECAKRTLTSGLPPARERAPPPPLGLHRPARDTHDWSRRPARPRPHMLLLPPCSRRRPFLREHTEPSLRTKPRDGHARYVTPGLT